ncbi:MAG TPA: bifunctional YncE family protein/alkaline phosphatase family protein [Terriglobales bacterium]|nr:bifunctional YncE family protein/alkaline phosphatase family protein [Terriglobales bacterium]
MQSFIFPKGLKRWSILAIFGCIILFCLTVLGSKPLRQRILLPTSKFLLGEIPGDPVPMGAFPVNVVVSPDKKFAAILEAGFGTADTEGRQSVSLLDLKSNEVTRFTDPRLGPGSKQTLFLGLAWSSDSKYLYVPFSSLSDPDGTKHPDRSTGNGIAVYAIESGKLTPQRFIKIPTQPILASKERGSIHKSAPTGSLVPFPSEITVVNTGAGDQLLVANNLSDCVLLMDAASGKITSRFDVSNSHYVPSAYPYGVVASADGKRAWVSLWNASTVTEMNLESKKVERSYKLRPGDSPTSSGSHPTAMALSHDGELLFVALSTKDEVAVINTVRHTVVGYLSTRLPNQKYQGAYPNSVAVSSDGATLAVANSGSNSVSVFPLAQINRKCSATSKTKACRMPEASGFIPTEWYPTAVDIVAGDLLITTGKGVGTGPNNIPRKVGQPGYSKGYTYIASLVKGSLARVKLAGAMNDLDKLTAEVVESNRMNEDVGELPFKKGKNPIKHVIYVIKENRTYDQILGDLGVGKGDPSLTMYGEDITPNQHALARQFGVLDNFYVSGEISGNGHVWSTAAISSDYTEKTWQIAYRSAERTYDYEGEVGNDFPLLIGIPDVNEPGSGYIWTNLARNKKTYRHYGEYVRTRWCGEERGWQAPQEGTPLSKPVTCTKTHINFGEPLPARWGGGKSPYPWPVPILAENIPSKPELRDHYDPNYPDFRMDFPDQLRADEFLVEFNSWVTERNKTKRDPMPQFITLRLPNNHTSGTKVGAPSPSAAVADNDLALGRVVEAISSSVYWDDTAIFVLEDDAQDGVDHVDAHRSPAFIISKYSPGSKEKPFVESGFYTTVNLIHTMEVVLGLPPMNNNDARAPIMASLFGGPGNQPAFKADYRNRENGLIYVINKKNAPGAKESAAMNFRHADGIDAQLLNSILWRDRKGDTKMPEPKHNVFPASMGRDDDDD